MKNFVLTRIGKETTYLDHLHPKAHDPGTLHVCYRSLSNGNWFCFDCGEKVPEPMQFVAELAGAERISQFAHQIEVQRGQE